MEKKKIIIVIDDDLSCLFLEKALKNFTLISIVLPEKNVLEKVLEILKENTVTAIITNQTYVPYNINMETIEKISQISKENKIAFINTKSSIQESFKIFDITLLKPIDVKELEKYLKA
jgi:hypothetical protein